MKRLRLDSAARAELLHETKYYEITRPGTGRRFREAVNGAFGRIARNPQAGRPEDDNCRRMRIEGFPFSAVYREEPSEIVIYAIRPDARKPGYWLARAK